MNHCGGEESFATEPLGDELLSIPLPDLIACLGLLEVLGQQAFLARDTKGTLTIDTQTAKVTLTHQENYTETRDSTREFDL